MSGVESNDRPRCPIRPSCSKQKPDGSCGAKRCPYVTKTSGRGIFVSVAAIGVMDNGRR